MSATMEKDENGNWFIRVPLVGKTKERLDAIVREVGAAPEMLAASMLHDILEDDEACHLSPDECVPPNTSLH